MGLAPILPKLTVSSCGKGPWRLGVESVCGKVMLPLCFGSQTTSIFVMSHLVNREPRIVSGHSRVGLSSSKQKGHVGQVVLRPLRDQHDHIVAGKPPLFVLGGLGAKQPHMCISLGAKQPLFL